MPVREVADSRLTGNPLKPNKMAEASMRFLHYGEMHSVIRITGPQHNYLAVTFAAEDKSPEPQVVELPSQGGCEHRPLDRAQILASVLAGVAEGNRKYGSDLIVASIQFVANDTGPEKVYQYMAKLLVEETLRHQSEQRASFEKLMAEGRDGQSWQGVNRHGRYDRPLAATT